jgi:hypothetical protein
MPRKNVCYVCGANEQYDDLKCARCWTLQGAPKRVFIIPYPVIQTLKQRQN